MGFFLRINKLIKKKLYKIVNKYVRIFCNVWYLKNLFSRIILCCRGYYFKEVKIIMVICVKEFLFISYIVIFLVIYNFLRIIVCCFKDMLGLMER